MNAARSSPSAAGRVSFFDDTQTDFFAPAKIESDAGERENSLGSDGCRDYKVFSFNFPGRQKRGPQLPSCCGPRFLCMRNDSAGANAKETRPATRGELRAAFLSAGE